MRHMNKCVFGCLTAVAVMGAIALSPATVAAQDYKGKTVTILVPYGPGGTYDKYSQTFAHNLGNHIAGKPNVIVQHMPGAGGLKAMNWAYKVMPPNGYNLLIPLDNTVLNQLLRPKSTRYDARDFTWLGSSNQTNMMIIVRSDTGVKSWKDMKKRQNVGATTGKASFGYITQALASSLLGFKAKLVQGYKGSAATTFAVERGEAEMNANNWLTYASKVPQWFKGNKPFARVVVQMGVYHDPDVPKGVPLLSDLVSDPLDKAAVDFVGVAGLLGRGLVLPPKASSGTVKLLRTAYDAMNADPAFEADLKKRHLRLIASKGETIQNLVKKAIESASPEVVAHARKLIYGK